MQLILCLASHFVSPVEDRKLFCELDPCYTVWETLVGRVSESTAGSRTYKKESQVLVLVFSWLLDRKLSVQVSSLPLQALFYNL